MVKPIGSQAWSLRISIWFTVTLAKSVCKKKILLFFQNTTRFFFLVLAIFSQCNAFSYFATLFKKLKFTRFKYKAKLKRFYHDQNQKRTEKRHKKNE